MVARGRSTDEIMPVPFRLSEEIRINRGHFGLSEPAKIKRKGFGPVWIKCAHWSESGLCGVPCGLNTMPSSAFPRRRAGWEEYD